MSSTYLIYKYTCAVSSKSYIGQTKDLSNRERGHCRVTSGCVAFRNAIQKYGWKNFSCEILAEHLTLEQANQLEPILIAQHNTIVPSGYNIRGGGNNGSIHPETKHKISQKLKGRVCSKETIEKRRQKTKGRPKSKEFVQRLAAANTGKVRTPEQRKKMSLARQGHVMSQETKTKIGKANKGKIYLASSCPHCGLVGGGNAMYRWHFDSCKHKMGV